MKHKRWIFRDWWDKQAPTEPFVLDKVFVDEPWCSKRNIENYINKFNNKIKSWVMERMAPVYNHRAYRFVMTYIKNIIATWFLVSLACWSLGLCLRPVKAGIGIVVILALAQYYLEWFFKVRKKYNK